MALHDYEEIVTNFAFPTLILAGPGSGKTYLLADRVRRLLDNGTDKDTITVLTFGVDARQHMIDELINPQGDFKIKFNELPHIATMHSLGFEIVQERPRAVNLWKTSLKVQDDENVKRLMFRDAAFILAFTQEDSKIALKCKQCGDCVENFQEKKCKICRKYREIMSKCNYIDFDDQILFACRILENNPDILEKYKSRAKHLLVDEYQDINAAQFKLIELLSRESRTGLFVVGDDAQSIYGFRGSDPKFILRFNEDFPGAETPPLPHSRRCHEKTMNDAFKILERYYTDWTGKQELEFHVKSGEEPSIWRFTTEIAEARMVAKIARSAIPQKTVLILVPKKEFFPLISKELSNQNVPHECPLDLLPERVQISKHFVDWVRRPSDNFLTRIVIEDLINNGIAKVPGAKKDGRCSPETIETRNAVETDIAKLWELVDRKNDLFSVIKDHKHLNEPLVKIRDGLCRVQESYNNLERENQGEFLKQLSIVTGIWCHPSEFAEDISTVVELLQSERPVGPGSVELKTMRKAKGLQADIVMIVGLEDDIVPNPYSQDMVEEARLFYVSMTRAKEKLFLFHSHRRPCNISFGKKVLDKQRSRFLDAIGRESEWRR
jgi:DNA helicase-2/ATP-dependent DNA helicase PcrA